MNRLTLVLGLLCSTFLVNGQSFKALVKAGDKAYLEKDYYAALYYYEDALEWKPDDVGLIYRYAEVARQFHSYDLAEKYYRKVLRNKDGRKAFPQARFWLGMVYKATGEYEKAIETFEEFLEKESTGKPELRERAKEEINNCSWGLEMLAHPEPIEVRQLNRRVNTNYSEVGALMKGDTLYYSSFRYDKKEDDQNPTRKITKLLYSIRGAKGRTMRRKFNDDQLHTAHTTFSLDGKRIYFTICDYVNGAEIRCQLYYREKDRRNRWEIKPTKLPEDINLKDFTNTHPSIGYDSTINSEVLYFVSDRPGGEGKLDIWWVKVEEGDNKFSRPGNLSQINTAGDDLTPFFHTPSQTLYFSSDGYQSMGGYDVFKTQPLNNWQEVINMGHPINTSYNDVYFSLTEDGESGFLSSNRLGSFYLDRSNKTCCNDIYQVNWGEEEVPVDTLIADVPTEDPDPTDEPGEDLTETPPTTLEDFLPLALYFDNDEPDRRTRRTTTKKNYEETYEKYIKRKEEYLREYTEPLGEEDIGMAEEVMLDFFEDKVQKGYDHLYLFSDLLLKRLEEGEQVEIFIKGFTSPRAKSDYNLALGKRRISSLINHFQTYQENVFQPYLDSGQLKITERSFGETTASSRISDALEDLRNSVYSVEAAQERRVEIVEIKRE